MTLFKHDRGNWVEFRKLPDLSEVDFHWSKEESRGNYYENMADVRKIALNSLIKAQQEGKKYVLLIHGWSTSRNGTTTSRSQIRGLMKHKDSTPYIIRKKCIQHDTVFVAAIRSVSNEMDIPT